MATSTAEKNELEVFRISTFEGLGFSSKDAKKLSEVKTRSNVNTKAGIRVYDEFLSWHKVKSMLENGCSHELALKILL